MGRGECREAEPSGAVRIMDEDAASEYDLPAMRIVLALAGVAALSASPEHILISRVFPMPGQFELAIANADGSGERPLLADHELDYDAAWSPDGQWLAFTSERNGSADIY